MVIVAREAVAEAIIHAAIILVVHTAVVAVIHEVVAVLIIILHRGHAHAPVQWISMVKCYQWSSLMPINQLKLNQRCNRPSNNSNWPPMNWNRSISFLRVNKHIFFPQIATNLR